MNYIRKVTLTIVLILISSTFLLSGDSTDESYTEDTWNVEVSSTHNEKERHQGDDPPDQEIIDAYQDQDDDDEDYYYQPQQYSSPSYSEPDPEPAPEPEYNPYGANDNTLASMRAQEEYLEQQRKEQHERDYGPRGRRVLWGKK